VVDAADQVAVCALADQPAPAVTDPAWERTGDVEPLTLSDVLTQTGTASEVVA